MLQVLAIKTRELSSVQSECSTRSSQLENKHAQELAAEREKALQVEEFSQNQIIAPFVKSLIFLKSIFAVLLSLYKTQMMFCSFLNDVNTYM